MYKSFMQIVALKTYDVCFQIAGFVLMLYCLLCTHAMLFAFYVMAGVQLLSVIYWTVILYQLPVKNTRKLLQKTFFIIVPVLLITCYFYPSCFYAISMVLAIAGPLIGISYFITTINEIKFYRNLIHRDAI